MLGEPIADGRDGSFVGGRSRMRPMKDSHFAEEHHRDSASFTFADVGSELSKQAFDVSPSDVPARGSNEDRFQSFLVLLPH